MILSWGIWKRLQVERPIQRSPIALGAPFWNTLLRLHSTYHSSLLFPHLHPALCQWGWPVRCADLLWWKSCPVPLVNLLWKEIGWIILSLWEGKLSAGHVERHWESSCSWFRIGLTLSSVHMWVWVSRLSCLSVFRKIRWLCWMIAQVVCNLGSRYIFPSRRAVN